MGRKKKRDRKRAKLPRKCKTDAGSDISEVSLNSTPVPSDNDVSSSDTGGRLNKKDGLTRYGNSHVKDKTS